MSDRATASKADGARLRLVARGAVQGVGFRPYVYRLAHQLGLTGWVRNDAGGVTIEAEGPVAALEALRLRLPAEVPPPAAVHGLEPLWLEPLGLPAFHIRASERGGPPRALVLPDIATCPACLRETFDPTARRHRYPFTNCTHCGPRFTIIDALPWDRARTSMAGFAMCARCRAEFEDPLDRRFHAQPIACPDCGPQLTWCDQAGHPRAARDEALAAAAAALRAGGIVAAMGLGGFHLLVDATDADAVARLRRAKARDEKPFALLLADVDAVRRECHVSPIEAGLLAAPEAPIVLLARRQDGGDVADLVAPGHPTFGVMLPCTPLHHLLLADVGRPLVATSGNLADEPICIDAEEAVQRLAGVADAFLVHDRPIRRHVDDAIVRVVAGRELVLRRGRGFAPWPMARPAGHDAPAAIAYGGQVKNAVAIATGGAIVLSQHVGDLGHPRAHALVEGLTDDLARLHGMQAPAGLVCDLHPDYDATRIARRRAADEDLNLVTVQHHYAHVRACMLENEVEAPVLGVAWDGTGYGVDGSVWGGEFLLVPPEGGFRRVAHLRRFRLPGGEAAVREPRRAALGLLHAIDGAAAWHGSLPPVAATSAQERRVFGRILDAGLRAPWTTSAGRLFDAIAALLDVRQTSAFEGQAAMLLEAAALDAGDAATPCGFLLADAGDGPLILDWEPAVAAMIAARRAGASTGSLARGVHLGLARAIVEVALRVRQDTGVERVALTGGCFQNALLTELTVDALRVAGLQPVWHQRVPPNDGGLALGQLAAALADGDLVGPPAHPDTATAIAAAAAGA